MKIIPIGNVFDKLYTMTPSFQNKCKPLVRQIIKSNSFEEKQRLAWKLAEKILNKESGDANPYEGD